MDRGDVEALEAALVDENHCVEVTADEASGRLVETPDRRSAVFYDVSVDGEPFAAASSEEFVHSLERAVARSEERSLQTRIRTIRANCLSEACSIAVVEFERRYALGEGRKAVPMRATALLRYFGGSEPRMRIYHWHASPATTSRTR